MDVSQIGGNKVKSKSERVTLGGTYGFFDVLIWCACLI